MKRIEKNEPLTDLKAFKLFFEKNYQLASLIAYRYTQDISAAEDITQDVFVTIWNRRKNIQLKSSLRSYLLAAIKKAAIKYIQRKKENTISIEEEHINEIQDDDHEENYSKEELALAINTAIEKLPSQRRKVFKLAYHEQMSYKEIANELEISINTVKTHIVQSYKSLKKLLADKVLTLIHFLLRKKIKNS